mmetsp:Transcript_23890/g.73149  ORF Transcript_23890/g.73149 Transcript_23890/m.73149 type:complete len:123 (+) Transcript_23890:335-703(+)
MTVNRRLLRQLAFALARSPTPEDEKTRYGASAPSSQAAGDSIRAHATKSSRITSTPEAKGSARMLGITPNSTLPPSARRSSRASSGSGSVGTSPLAVPASSSSRNGRPVSRDTTVRRRLYNE